MGGNAKRMSFIHENLDLTFNEMFEIYKQCGLGSRQFIEKFDGVNLFFRYDSDEDKIRFSRNKGHLMASGLTSYEMAEFFENHPAEKQFAAAVKFICDNKKAISQSWEKHVTSNLPGVFEEKVYVNLDYLDPKFHQTLKYDSQAIAMHNIWVFDDKWENDYYLHPRYFSNFIKELQSLSDDVMIGQVEIHTEPISFEDIKWLRDEINKEITPKNLSWDNTIEEYVRFCIQEIAIEKCQISNLHDVIEFGNILLGYGKRNDLRNLNKRYPEVREITNKWISSQKRTSTILKLLLPLVIIGEKIGATILKNVSSSAIHNSRIEAKRLDIQMNHAIRLVGEGKCGNWKSMISYLKRYNESFCGVPTIEGVVFAHEGNIYKITGSFSTMNRIIGEARY